MKFMTWGKKKKKIIIIEEEEGDESELLVFNKFWKLNPFGFHEISNLSVHPGNY